MKTSSVIPVSIVVGGLIIAGAVYFTVNKSGPSTASGTGDPSLVTPISSSDHVLGNPAAKVEIIEYSDFDCSYCKDFQSTLHQAVATLGNNGSIAWVYRNNPITQLHPNAYKAAEAAECVALTAGNDLYWKFADSLFAHQPVDPTQYAQYAKAAGADPNTVATCEENAPATVDGRINADMANAAAIGAQGTPYSLIVVAGHAPIVIDGAYPFNTLSTQIQQALSY